MDLIICGRTRNSIYLSSIKIHFLSLCDVVLLSCFSFNDPYAYSHVKWLSGRQLFFMAIALKSACFLPLKKPEVNFQGCFPSKKAVISVKRYTPVAAIRTMETVGLSETFSRLKNQGKVSGYFSCCLASMYAMFSVLCDIQLELLCIAYFFFFSKKKKL